VEFSDAGSNGRNPLGARGPSGSTETVRDQLARLAQDNYRGIYNLVYSYIGGDAEEAEDLTLQTFENAFAAAHRFRGDADLRTWLFRIAINACKNRIRHKQARRKIEAFSLDAAFEPGGDGGAEVVDIPDETLAPAQVAQNRELREVLRRGIRDLAPDYREVLLLKLEDLSYREIAGILEVTVETVKSRLFRARSALKRKVCGYVEGI
jgi:RNA polymerase sigma-70 factor (ECF subfamily)